MKTETTTPSTTATNPSVPTPKRRMRRHARTQSTISNHKSELPRRRPRAKPFQPLPQFAHLRPDQLEYIHDLLRDSTLADVQQQLHMDLGVRLSSTTLHRYRAQLDLADQLQLGTDTASALDQLRDLYAGRQTDLDAAGLQVIKQRALALASAPKSSPTLLKDLHRIFTYEDRKQEKQQTLALRHNQRLELAQLREQTRLQIANQREATRQLQLDLAQKRYELELRKQQHREKIDHRKTPEQSSHDQARENVEAIMAYGREYLRREREKDAAAQSFNGGVSSTSPTSISRDAISPPSAAPADLNSQPMETTKN